MSAVNWEKARRCADRAWREAPAPRLSGDLLDVLLDHIQAVVEQIVSRESAGALAHLVGAEAAAKRADLWATAEVGADGCMEYSTLTPLALAIRACRAELTAAPATEPQIPETTPQIPEVPPATGAPTPPQKTERDPDLVRLVAAALQGLCVHDQGRALVDRDDREYYEARRQTLARAAVDLARAALAVMDERAATHAADVELQGPTLIVHYSGSAMLRETWVWRGRGVTYEQPFAQSRSADTTLPDLLTLLRPLVPENLRSLCDAPDLWGALPPSEGPGWEIWQP